MRNQRKSVTILALVLAILMVLSLFTGIFMSLAQGRSLADIDREINDARNQINNIGSRSEEIAGQVGSLQGQLALLREEEGVYLEELNILQEQLDLLREQITLTEEQIDLYIQMILDKELRLEEAIAREEEQLALYTLRIRAMEERGSLSYLQILLSARSFSDLVTRIRDAGSIMEHDQRIAEALERYRIAVYTYRNELQADQATLETLVRQLEIEREHLQHEADEVQRLIDELEERIQASEIEIAALQAEQDRLAAEMLSHAQNLSALDAARAEAIRELERQAAAGQNPGGGGMGGTPARPPATGMFVWPSDFTSNVTSGFGPRWGQFHAGIDIAAAGINGTNVIAAASGYVVMSGWNGGFGNHIMIRHGNGYYTVYAHMSSNLVSAGQNVVQGQVIGLVGSTGWSTGPHIHFEIIRGGVHVDPMLYF